MLVETLCITVFAVVVLGGIVVAANHADRENSSRKRFAVIIALVLINGLAFMVGLSLIVLVSDQVATWEGGLVTWIMAGLATLVLFRAARGKIAILFPTFQSKIQSSPDTQLMPPFLDEAPGDKFVTSGEPLFPQMLNYYTTDMVVAPLSMGKQVSQNAPEKSQQSPVADQARGFNPDSTVHMVALVYCIYFLGVQIVSFVLGGGLEGIAEQYDNVGITGWDLLLNSLPFVMIPVLGVGLGVRRDRAQVLRRLGLGGLTFERVAVAVGVAIVLLGFVWGVNMMWSRSVSEQTFEEQTQAAKALSDSVTTLGIAFLIAATAAIGEEIAFRGALQPIFGLWPTAIIFALIHIQYTLTPITLIIFVVALALGWIRLHYNTTTAILMHFLYNFIPLMLILSVPDDMLGWIRLLL